MKRGMRWIIIVLLLIIVGLVGVVAYMTWWKQDASINSPAPQAETHKLSTHIYTSVKGITIELDNWPNDGVITNPLTMTGKVPGNWSSEGVFLIELLDESGARLSRTTATLHGDWMTDALVPFTATLTYNAATVGSTGVLVLRKDNPSDLPENDDSVRIEVHFSS